MEYPVNVMLEVDDTIWQLWWLDTKALKNAKPGENWVIAYMPEKKSFWFIKLAGKRKIDPRDLEKYNRNKR